MTCKNCEVGQVYAPLGEHFVTRDMAIDAGNPEMEGMSMGVEWGWITCDCCQGDYENCDCGKMEFDKKEVS